MRPGYDESPLNPVPAVIWLLALPMIACEAVFGLAQIGLLGGGSPGAGLAMRQIAVERTAYIPEFVLRQLQMGVMPTMQGWRVLTYPFVHYSITHALFVIVFTLALGNTLQHSQLVNDDFTGLPETQHGQRIGDLAQRCHQAAQV